MIIGDNFGTVTVEPGGPLCEIQLSSLPGARFQSEPHCMCDGLAASPPLHDRSRDRRSMDCKEAENGGSEFTEESETHCIRFTAGAVAVKARSLAFHALVAQLL